MLLSDQTLNITPPPHLIFGVNAIRHLPEQIRLLGRTRALIVTDAGLVRAGLAQKVQAVLSEAKIESLNFEGVQPNPTIDNITAGSACLSGLDLDQIVVVALGGGSSMDTAKGIALHATNGGEVVNLDYRVSLPFPALPIIAIPTTAGTGSEQNSYGVITNPHTQRRFYVGNDSAQPKVAILDPELTIKLPPAATAATGMDVLSHALESLASRNANPYADAINLEVIHKVTHWLPLAYADGTQLEARAQMLLASSMVALAYRSGTGMGLAHAIGHALGGRLNVAHGMALSIVLGDVIRFNLAANALPYARAAWAMGVADPARSAIENAEAAAATVDGLAQVVGMKRPLASLGVTSDVIDLLVTDALEDVVLYNNPIQPTAEQVRAIIVKNC